VRDGVELVLGAQLERVSRDGPARCLHLRGEGGAAARVIAVDQILVGIGRAPNVEGLGLEAAGVAYDVRRGVRVSDVLRTSNPRIFAVGDCCLPWQFTHAADASAKIAVRNALFPFLPKQKLSKLVMPWCTYTDPEIAHVGMYARDAEAAGIAIDTFQVPLEKVNRAVIDGESEGFVKVHVRRGSDRVVGATVVSSHAGELISQLTLMMVGGLGLGTLLGVIYPYPTQAEGIKRVAGEHARTRLTPTVKGLFERWMRWSRR
jgi:pyruvate/2-oxoglutarate dehydrogenase complex dihydrolipoamide dehydrogenase (E3) component